MKTPSTPTRRKFLSTTTATAAGATLATLAPAIHAGSSEVLRIGLIGCGNRGTGAAGQALHADPNVKLVAMGDLFADQLQSSLAHLKNDDAIAAKIDVGDRKFSGWDAYKQVLTAGVDVVLLATPPHFRPAHFKAAVEAGKHIFAEKPVAVDAPGVRSVLQSVRLAKEKNLAVVSGLCWRYHHGMRDTMKRVHGGDIGDLLVLQCTYNTGGLWSRPLSEKKAKGWSDMEWQLRNWLYFTWLSGDHNVEQHIHSLDKMAWALQDQYPVKAVGVGGRQTRTAADFGHIFDHHAVVYEYANGLKLFSMCRQQNGCAQDVSDHLFGTRGICDIQASRSRGVIRALRTNKEIWRSDAGRRRRPDNMYQNEHDDLFACIRAGKPINNGDYMAKSTLMAIMGRMATYTGQEIGWDQALNSKEDLTPPKYEFGPYPVAPIARPGITKFI